MTFVQIFHQPRRFRKRKHIKNFIYRGLYFWIELAMVRFFFANASIMSC